MIEGWSVVATHISGVRALDLICDGFIWNDVKEDKRIGFKRGLSNKVVLVGEDYAWLWSIRNSPQRCAPLRVNLSKDSFSQDYSINVNKVNWDHTQCTAKLALETISVYKRIDDNNKKEINILDTAIKHTAVTVVGDVVTQAVSDTAILTHFYDNRLLDAPPPPAGEGWILKDLTLIYYEREGDILEEPSQRAAVYAREEFTAVNPPLGGGWINESGNLWVRPVSMAQVFAGTTYTPDPIDPNDPSNDEQSGQYRFVLNQEVLGGNSVYSNGVKFRDLIVSIFGDLGFQINSRFFNTGNTTANADHLPAVYDWSDVYLSELLIYQKSDIKRPLAENDATNGIMNYEQFFKILDILQARYRVEDYSTSPITIRLEHESYFKSSLGLDLTEPRFLNQIVNLTEQEGESIDIPKVELFEWMEKTGREFDGAPISYPISCATTDSVSIRAEMLTNDISKLGHDNNDQYDDQGFTLVSIIIFNNENIIASTVNPLTGNIVLNNPMGFPVLHDILYRNSTRKYASGAINEGQAIFDSYNNTLKRNVEITGFSLDEYVAFDPSQTVVDDLGLATVEQATYDEDKCKLSLELSYP